MQKLVQKKVVFYLFVINLIGSILVPSLASAIGSQTQVLFCTSEGYQWVTIEVEQDLTDNAGSQEHCMVCVMSNDDLELSDSSYNYLTLKSAKALICLISATSQHNNVFLRFRQPRAPPFFI